MGDALEQPEEAADAPDAPRPSGAPVPSDTPEAVPAADTAAPAAAAPDEPRGRRRGRFAALIGAAAALGVIAGACAGYLVQAGREPTPLPPLSQPVLEQDRGKAPAPLSAAQDRRVKTDGDLRELLLDVPRGADPADPDEWPEGSDGWLDLAEYANGFEETGAAFGDILRNEFRRAAVTAWDDEDHSVEIVLVQYRQEEYMAASEASSNGQYWAEEAGSESWAIPGTGNGRAYVLDEPETEPGYLPLYSAQAHAWRGDIAMEIWMYGSEPIKKKAIMDLAERQMERL
nr:hypothetical protein [Streptomyces viridosporus]